ncbi:hypothetical protein H2198_005928 [Neophaeococcomyces mojaviensis]|uniref:Uncharacterized protein n=1 Tax=Neophaeococcomyces mojaviensis TaxID=3383035 RepID=A0ACC3A4B7_9EURO|nr:hypothetical protein H2198_005928 [Knufia sp. JES_112]
MAERLPTTVDKATPYTYDLAHLSATDPNPLPSTSSLLSQSLSARNETLKSIARDGTQTLLTTLLTSPSVTIASTRDLLLMTLPPCDPANQTPRWKPLPKPKEPTKWEQFAKKKGIGKYGGNLKGGAALEDRRKNAVYDEEKGEWVKKWGYKGKKEPGAVQDDWLVELDDKQVKKERGLDDGKTIRNEGKREKMERLRRQERKERNNAKKQGRNKT